MRVSTFLLLVAVVLALGACKKEDGPGFDGKTCRLTQKNYESGDGSFWKRIYYHYAGDYVSHYLTVQSDKTDTLFTRYTYKFDDKNRLIDIWVESNDTWFPEGPSINIGHHQYLYYPDSVVMLSLDVQPIYRSTYVYDKSRTRIAYYIQGIHDTTFYSYKDDLTLESRSKLPLDSISYQTDLNIVKYDGKGKKYVMYPDRDRGDEKSFVGNMILWSGTIFYDNGNKSNESINKVNYEYNSSGYPSKSTSSWTRYIYSTDGREISTSTFDEKYTYTCDCK